MADPGRIVYRRRVRNTGFKAGNVHEFCETHGRDYDLMLPLDADSLMSGEAIVRLVRIMQAHPQLGILQSLVVGAPSTSAFARIFQFGMRHGMRAYTMGSAWWIGDCGPFWGHNALVRIAPFAEHCRLPVLPGGKPLGGHVLSHDQVEATLMRKAGYEVRVLPTSAAPGRKTRPPSSSFRPATCAGARATCSTSSPGPARPPAHEPLPARLGDPDVRRRAGDDGDDRARTLKVIEAEPAFPAGAAVGLYVTFLLMYLSPKLAGLADILLARDGVARYGGTGAFSPAPRSRSCSRSCSAPSRPSASRFS